LSEKPLADYDVFFINGKVIRKLDDAKKLPSGAYKPFERVEEKQAANVRAEIIPRVSVSIGYKCRFISDLSPIYLSHFLLTVDGCG
jgi:hypothetical protein